MTSDIIILVCSVISAVLQIVNTVCDLSGLKNKKR